MHFIEWKNGPFQVRAQVDVLRNPSDILLWDAVFAPALVEGWNSLGMSFNGSQSDATYGEINLDSGAWRVEATSGDFNDSGHRVEIQLNGEHIGQLDALGQRFEVNIPYGETGRINGSQNQGHFVANVNFQQTYRHTQDGQAPVISGVGDILTVDYPDQWNRPRPGVILARAKVYDANGDLRATSNDLTLTISGGSGGS